MRADQGRLHAAQTRRHESAEADVRKLRAGVRDMGDGMMLLALLDVREPSRALVKPGAGFIFYFTLDIKIIR
jgi:hypothetical protein